MKSKQFSWPREKPVKSSIIVDLEEVNLVRFVRIVKELGYKSKVPVRLEDLVRRENRERWIKEKGMRVFSLFDPEDPFFLVDIFVEIPFDFNKVYDLREKMKAGKILIPVVPLRELIAMKEKAGRPQDKADVFYLKRITDEWKDEE